MEIAAVLGSSHDRGYVVSLLLCLLVRAKHRASPDSLCFGSNILIFPDEGPRIWNWGGGIVIARTSLFLIEVKFI